MNSVQERRRSGKRKVDRRKLPESFHEALAYGDACQASRELGHGMGQCMNQWASMEAMVKRFQVDKAWMKGQLWPWRDLWGAYLDGLHEARTAWREGCRRMEEEAAIEATSAYGREDER